MLPGVVIETTMDVTAMREKVKNIAGKAQVHADMNEPQDPAWTELQDALIVLQTTVGQAIQQVARNRC